jgi:hypothetical protein
VGNEVVEMTSLPPPAARLLAISSDRDGNNQLDDISSYMYSCASFASSAAILLVLDGGEAKNATDALRHVAKWLTAIGFMAIIGVLTAIFAVIELSRLLSS